MYRGLLGPRERLEKIMDLGTILDKTAGGLTNHLAKTAVAKALPRLSQALSYLPHPLEKPARTQKAIKQRERTPTPIAYFLGCGTNVFTPQAAMASVKALETLGFKVSIPPISCCGGPHFAAGDMAKARRLAKKNLKILGALNPETIVTECATCAHTLADYRHFFPKTHPLQSTIADFSARVMDLNTFWINALAAPQKMSPITGLKTAPPTDKILKVTYHDPCHALRGLGIKNAPRQIIQALPGLELVEMEGADSCCGGAGSYAFRHPGMSQKILDQKIEAIVATGADILATSCPSCTLQIGAGLRRAGLSIPVRHPMELIHGTRL